MSSETEQETLGRPNEEDSCWDEVLVQSTLPYVGWDYAECDQLALLLQELPETPSEFM